MTNIWHGADPAGAVDAGAYELGSVVVALEAVTLNGIRVWSPANAVMRSNRRGHVWSMTGTLLATITMTDALPSGWSTHLLGSPLSLDAGDFVVISYETSGNYGFAANTFATDTYVASDEAMAFPLSKAVANFGTSHGNGRFSTTPATAPDSSSSAWYGVDADYTAAGGGGGTAPTLALALTTDGLDVTANLSATDPDGLTSATYAVAWGDGQTSSGPGVSFTHTYADAGLHAILASVTDSTGLAGYRAGAVELIPPGRGFADVDLDRLVSHAMAAGLFDRVDTHEPKNAPGNGLTAAIWADRIEPIRKGGLDKTSMRVSFSIRIYSNMVQEPQNDIDPNIMTAVAVLFEAYSGDFTLGGTARHIDLLGQYGIGLSAQAGYLNQDGRLYRVMTITVPIIYNDLFEQVA